MVQFAGLAPSRAVGVRLTSLSGSAPKGTLTFTSCRIDGKALASEGPSGYLRANRAGIVQIAPGPLSPAGTAFTTYYNYS